MRNIGIHQSQVFMYSVHVFSKMECKKPKQSTGGGGDDNGGSGGGAVVANCHAPLPQQCKMEVVEKNKK